MRSPRSSSDAGATRDLLAIAGSLSRAGDSADVPTVAARLGISEGDARELLEVLVEVGTDDGLGRLPLALDNDGSVTLLPAAGRSVFGRALRLTAGEAQALSATFDELGMAPHDEMRRAITEALYPTAPGTGPTDAGESTATQTSSVPDFPPELLDTLSQAILAGVAIEFGYRPAVSQGLRAPRHADPSVSASPTRRQVQPLALRRERDYWYLDAHDMGRGATRSFRLDRMEGPVTTISAETDSPTNESTPSRTVHLTFTDRTLLELFDWPGLAVTGHGHGSVNCDVPWYPGSSWLPRHLAACGSGVRVYDPELRAATRDYAERLLGMSAEA